MKSAFESFHPKKVAQEKDTDTNILKQKSDFFAFHVQKDINACISTSKFLNDLKEVDVTPVYKKKSKLSKENYKPKVSFQISLKCMKGACMIKCQNTLKLDFPNFSAVFERV